MKALRTDYVDLLQCHSAKDEQFRTAVIPGCKSPEQVRDNAAAADLDLGQPGHPQAA